MAYTDRGKDVLLDFAERASELGLIEKAPKMEGRSMVMFLSPKKDK
jgi:translation initiation factor IF-3